MLNSKILSTLPVAAAPPAADSRPLRLLVFDACQVGVVLRAVALVQAVVAVVLMPQARGLWEWVLLLMAWSAATQPAVLAWLVAGCVAKRWLAARPLALQVGAGVGMGALAGLWVLANLRLLALVGPPRAGMVWASACAGAGVAAVLVAALVWRVRAQVPAGTAARLAELQARIRPHFLFNSLNSAVALVREQPQQAEALLEDLSELFRAALASPSAEPVRLKEELVLAKRYLAIEQVRFGPRLRVHWELDEAAEGALLPPLILQPLVENAVRHGVEPSAQGAQVWVRTQRRGERVVVEVVNTAPAGPGRTGAGLALANVAERLALLHDMRARLRSGWVQGRFVVRMEVPA